MKKSISQLVFGSGNYTEKLPENFDENGCVLGIEGEVLSGFASLEFLGLSPVPNNSSPKMYVKVFAMSSIQSTSLFVQSVVQKNLNDCQELM